MLCILKSLSCFSFSAMRINETPISLLLLRLLSPQESKQSVNNKKDTLPTYHVVVPFPLKRGCEFPLLELLLRLTNQDLNVWHDGHIIYTPVILNISCQIHI